MARLIQTGTKARYINIANTQNCTITGNVNISGANTCSGFSSNDYLTIVPGFDTTSSTNKRSSAIVICFSIPSSAGLTSGTILSSNGDNRLRFSVDNDGSNNFLKISFGSGSTWYKDNVASYTDNSSSHPVSTQYLDFDKKYVVKFSVWGSYGKSYGISCSGDGGNTWNEVFYYAQSGSNQSGRWNTKASILGKDASTSNVQQPFTGIIHLNDCYYGLPRNEDAYYIDWVGGTTTQTEVTSTDPYTDTITYPVIKASNIGAGLKGLYSTTPTPTPQDYTYTNLSSDTDFGTISVTTNTNYLTTTDAPYKATTSNGQTYTLSQAGSNPAIVREWLFNRSVTLKDAQFSSGDTPVSVTRFMEYKSNGVWTMFSAEDLPISNVEGVNVVQTVTTGSPNMKFIVKNWIITVNY